VVTTAADGSTRLTRTDTGESISLVVAGGAWLAYSDDGYFDASRIGDALLGVAARGRGHRVDQLAVRNNRPDLLLSRMGIGAPGAIDPASRASGFERAISTAASRPRRARRSCPSSRAARGPTSRSSSKIRRGSSPATGCT
jgi:hypothetical protein